VRVYEEGGGGEWTLRVDVKVECVFLNGVAMDGTGDRVACAIAGKAWAGAVVGVGAKREVARLVAADGGDGCGVTWSGDGRSVMMVQGSGRVTKYTSEGWGVVWSIKLGCGDLGWLAVPEYEEGGRRVVVPVYVAGKRSVILDDADGRVVGEVGGDRAYAVRVIGACRRVVTGHDDEKCIRVSGDMEARVDVGGDCRCIGVEGGGGGVLAGAGNDVVLVR
jgi:hypothetical protein